MGVLSTATHSLQPDMVADGMIATPLTTLPTRNEKEKQELYRIYTRPKVVIDFN